MPASLRLIAICSLVAVAAVAPGCGRNLQNSLGLPNSPPEVHLESAPLATGDAEALTAHLTWTATDPDGRVDHYLVTTDLAALSRETEGWSVTTERRRTLQVRRAVRGAAQPAGRAEPEFDVFAVRAVDDRGAVSKPASRAFFGENVAPTVRITRPVPTPLLAPWVTPQVRIVWEGVDPDGHPDRPVRYKYKLFKLGSDIPWRAWYADPDSLRRQFAPAFAGWDSLDGKETELVLSGLQVGAQYLFVLTAFDREGAYDPVFSLDKNVLLMTVMAGTAPQISIYTDFFNYTQMGPSNPAPEFVLPGVGPFTIHWVARSGGAPVTGYRWALDPKSLEDGPGATAAGWSRWSPDLTSATIGPFDRESGDTHTFYVEARDWNEGHALAWVRLRIVIPTFQKDLLIVDDTAFRPDMRSHVPNPASPESLMAPIGPWPTAAELDTFLYAVGGVRWRMTPNCTLSPAGVFRGYRFDTLGTRQGRENPTIPLEILGQYRHIIWIADQYAPLLPYMSEPNRSNTLAMWVAAGGKLWALGGGFGNATNAPWNNRANDDLRGPIYSALGTRPDLAPGRFMYDWTHWRSEFRVLRLAGGHIARADPYVATPSAIPTALPWTLAPRWPGTDPLPPLRTASSFYNPTYGLEYLTRPNVIAGPKNPSPRHAEEIPVLDTLMVGVSPLMPPLPDSSGSGVATCMTYYHGPDCGPLVFSGFDIWTWRRINCVGLVDAVLGGIWGLTRDAAPAGNTAGDTRRKKD